MAYSNARKTQLSLSAFTSRRYGSFAGRAAVVGLIGLNPSISISQVAYTTTKTQKTYSVSIND